MHGLPKTPQLQLANAQCVCRALDDIGDATNCWRLSRRESDRAFAWRLAIHIQEQIIDREELLEMVLSLGRFPGPVTTETEGDT